MAAVFYLASITNTIAVLCWVFFWLKTYKAINLWLAISTYQDGNHQVQSRKLNCRLVSCPLLLIICSVCCKQIDILCNFVCLQLVRLHDVNVPEFFITKKARKTFKRWMFISSKLQLPDCKLWDCARKEENTFTVLLYIGVKHLTSSHTCHEASLHQNLSEGMIKLIKASSLWRILLMSCSIVDIFSHLVGILKFLTCN